jgi:outer membrane protein assembly factor BamA
MQLFRLFGQKSGIAFFTDIGNIWDRQGPYALTLQSLTRDFAWDLGTGLRIGSPIGPFRFDFAWKIHDPSNPQPWRISKSNLTDFTFNFGIGEAF